MNKLTAKIKAATIKKIVDWLAGRGVFARILNLVYRYEDSDIKNTEKHQRVFDEARRLGIDVASWVLNAAIDLAVGYIRTKINEK